MTIIHTCSAERVQPSVDELCMSENWFGYHQLEKCCYPERDPCTDEMSCEEELAQMKQARTKAALAFASNGTLQSISRDGRSKTYRGVTQIKNHLGWLDQEIDRLERKCGRLSHSCSTNNPSSIGFTGGRW